MKIQIYFGWKISNPKIDPKITPPTAPPNQRHEINPMIIDTFHIIIISLLIHNKMTNSKTTIQIP
jgi:hypothetical protein